MKIKKIIVANKCDMESSRVVGTKEGMELAQKYGAEYYETSAKTGQNISEMFDTMVNKIVMELPDDLEPIVKPKSAINMKSKSIFEKDIDDTSDEPQKTCC
jgi:predicted GTPase